MVVVHYLAQQKKQHIIAAPFQHLLKSNHGISWACPFSLLISRVRVSVFVLFVLWSLLLSDFFHIQRHYCRMCILLWMESSTFPGGGNKIHHLCSTLMRIWFLSCLCLNTEQQSGFGWPILLTEAHQFIKRMLLVLCAREQEVDSESMWKPARVQLCLA